MAILKTNKFPGELIAAVGDGIPHFCRSARVWENDDGTGQASADESEIVHVRRAIRLAKENAAANAAMTTASLASRNIAAVRAARTGR